MFMGSSIGNFTPAEALQFCTRLRQQLQPGDLLMIGFDLRKNPQTILDAYNDKAGITRAFNLNLLERINRELDGDFDLSQFTHFPTYDPLTGACRSFLVSLKEQAVHIAGKTVRFAANEPCSWKYRRSTPWKRSTNWARAAGSSRQRCFTTANAGLPTYCGNAVKVP